MKIEGLTKVMPQEILDYVDESLLPTYADGNNTATNIADLSIEDANAFLATEFEPENTGWFYNAKIIAPWIVVTSHRQLLIDYIQYVLDEWAEDGEQDEN